MNSNESNRPKPRTPYTPLGRGLAEVNVMTEPKPGVISVGEVMIELTRGPDGRYGLAFGGDTFNTAVYLARAGIDVAYATALGDDPYSDALLALAAAEGVRTELIVRVPAPCSWRRSSASTSRCRRSTTKHCCGAT